MRRINSAQQAGRIFMVVGVRSCLPPSRTQALQIAWTLLHDPITADSARVQMKLA